MVWFRSDDNLLDHPKWIGLPDAAKVLWHEAGMWASRHLTDGVVPPSYFASRPGSLASARDLVRSGLWSKGRGGGYQFHDWSDWNPTREKVEAERKAAAERQQRFREARRNGVRNAVTNTSPTRPDPPPKGGEGRRRATPAARADPKTRCPRHPTELADPCPTCRSEQIGAA